MLSLLIFLLLSSSSVEAQFYNQQQQPFFFNNYNPWSSWNQGMQQSMLICILLKD